MDIGEAEKRQSSLASGTVGIPICQKVDLATITGHRDQVHHPSMFCPNSKIHPSTKALTAFMRCSSQDLCSQTRGNHIICGVKPQPKCLEHTHSHGNLNHMRHVLRFRVSLSPQTPGCGCSTGPAQNHSRYSENRCSAAKMPNNLDSGHCKACHKCSHFQNQEVMQKRPKSAFDDVAYVKSYFSLLSPLESYLDLRRMHLQPAAKKSGP